jgi:uncharacterized protein (TIGR03435 family)
MISAFVCPSRKLTLFAALILALPLFASPLALAQASASINDVHAKGDIAGDWQGTLQAGKSLRLIVKITKAEKGFAAKFYTIDQAGGTPIAVNSVTLDGTAVKMSVDLIGGTYAATLSADGNSMVGTWTQGPNPLPLTLVRATKETAWEMPAPPPPPKSMPADADPTFDVATIKPNDSGNPNMQGLRFAQHGFMTVNSSLLDLIEFAYNVQAKQIVGAPDWASKDHYDISAVPDIEGVPNPKQMRSLVAKLIADRFKLTFHKDHRDMAAFVLTVAKTGEKIKPTEHPGPAPGFGLRPSANGVSIPVFNSDMAEFSGVLQSMVLDRPVVNQTGLTGHYDFVLTFTPDDSQFNGHPPKLNGQTPPADAPDAAPSLFDAMPKELGLKLEAQKTAVEVIAIDHVDKPSAN